MFRSLRVLSMTRSDGRTMLYHVVSCCITRRGLLPPLFRQILETLQSWPWQPSQSGRWKQDFGPKANFKKQQVKLPEAWRCVSRGVSLSHLFTFRLGNAKSSALFNAGLHVECILQACVFCRYCDIVISGYLWSLLAPAFSLCRLA